MDKPNPTLWLAPLLAAQAACGARAATGVASAPVDPIPSLASVSDAPISDAPIGDAPIGDAELTDAEPLTGTEPQAMDVEQPSPEPANEGDPTRCEPARLDLEAWNEPGPAADPAGGAFVRRSERPQRAFASDSQSHEAGAHLQGDALDASTIRNVVRRHSDGFMGCYQLGLGRDPHLQGRVTTRFDIDAKGKISELTIAANELPDCSVIECIRDHFITIQFPPPGNVVTVLYPLVFGHAD